MTSSWPTLTFRLKQKIIGLLDYESRCNLRICSKDDRNTVDTTKFIPKTFKMSELQSEMSEGKTIIRIDIDSFIIWFIGKENVTRIDRGWNGEIVINELSQIKQINRYELIAQFLEKFSDKGVIKAGSVELDSIEFAPFTTWKFQTDIMKLQNINNHYVEWANNCIPFGTKFKIFEGRCWGEGDLAPLLSKIQVSKSLRIDHDIVLNDEELGRIEAPDLSISSTTGTAEGAKKRLEYFLKNGKKTDKMELSFQAPPNFNALTHVIPNKLVVKKLKKENEQDGEYYGKIFGGFTNIHGITEPREIDFMQFGNMVRMYCGLWENSKRPCLMYPFYHLRIVE